jgi:hypothetical protein
MQGHFEITEGNCGVTVRSEGARRVRHLAAVTVPRELNSCRSFHYCEMAFSFLE